MHYTSASTDYPHQAGCALPGRTCATGEAEAGAAAATAAGEGDACVGTPVAASAPPPPPLLLAGTTLATAASQMATARAPGSS